MASKSCPKCGHRMQRVLPFVHRCPTHGINPQEVTAFDPPLRYRNFTYGLTPPPEWEPHRRAGDYRELWRDENGALWTAVSYEEGRWTWKEVGNVYEKNRGVWVIRAKTKTPNTEGRVGQVMLTKYGLEQDPGWLILGESHNWLTGIEEFPELYELLGHAYDGDNIIVGKFRLPTVAQALETMRGPTEHDKRLYYGSATHKTPRVPAGSSILDTVRAHPYLFDTIEGGNVRTRKPIRLAFVGKMGSGKSTLAEWARDEWGLNKLSFAGPLKDLAKIKDDLPESEWFSALQSRAYQLLSGSPTQKPGPYPGARGVHNPPMGPKERGAVARRLAAKWLHDFVESKDKRELLQRIGTDSGRSIDPQIWIRNGVKKIKASEDYAIDDVRFVNEADALRERGFLIVKLSLDQLERAKRIADRDKISLYDAQKMASPLNAHPSETEQDDIDPDAVIDMSRFRVDNLADLKEIVENRFPERFEFSVTADISKATDALKMLDPREAVKDLTLYGKPIGQYINEAAITNFEYSQDRETWPGEVEHTITFREVR